jgi:hypothetical protein
MFLYELSLCALISAYRLEKRRQNDDLFHNQSAHAMRDKSRWSLDLVRRKRGTYVTVLSIMRIKTVKKLTREICNS